MNIVILDAKTIGEDMNFQKLNEFGNVKIFKTTSQKQTIERIIDADIIITNKVVLDTKELESAKKLKLICVAATGYNNINVKAANKKNIAVTNVKGYSTESVAQQLFAYILTFYNSIVEYQKDIKSNKWQKSEIFTLLNHQIFELKEKTIGIIGYGAIGKRVAEIAKVFGMKVIIAKIPGRNYDDNTRLSLHEVLKKSDIVTIHAPLTELTRNLIAAKELSMMKKNAILANYSRGGIVNEKNLFSALKKEAIRGAIVDVLTEEPPQEGNILFNAPNLFITPHTAWTSVEARKKLVEGIINNIVIFKAGNIAKIKIEN